MTEPGGQSVAAARRGMTLVELLISISLISVIALCTAMMMSAVAGGTTQELDSRSVSIGRKLISMRIDAAVRSSRRFLSMGDHHVVLWMADSRADDKANLSELRRIEFDPETGELTDYRADFPDDWTEEQVADADATFDFGEDFDAITQKLMAGARFPGTPWSNQVADVRFSLDEDSPENAEMLLYELTLVRGTQQHVTVGAAGLRGQ